MKLLLLSDINSAHTIKWVSGLKNKNIDVAVFSFSDVTEENRYIISGITFCTASINNTVINSSNQLIKLARYLGALPRLKKLIRDFQPDIINAHYVSSYGFIGSLAGFKKLIITAWGSEVFKNPHINFINKYQVKRVLNSAAYITSSSKYMADEIKKYTRKPVAVIPFGIDITQFKKINQPASNSITIGTIKSLESYYGIETLISAFSIVVKKLPAKKLALLITGDGKLKNDLIKKATALNILNDVTFEGKIPYTEIVNSHNKLNIFVAPSLRESFGVSLLEAMSCERAVIASDIPAFKEIIEGKDAGLLFKAGNENDLAEKIYYLINNPDEIERLGKNARLIVEKEYDWAVCLNKMVDLYQSLL